MEDFSLTCARMRVTHELIVSPRIVFNIYKKEA